MPTPIIAREGWVYIAIACLVTLVVQSIVGFWWALPLWCTTVFVIQFFRDPERIIPEQLGAVVSPAHGRIVSIERCSDPYVDRKALKIGIFMNVFSVHSNRAPVAGEIKGNWYRSGAFFNAALDKSSERNEQNAIWIRTNEDIDVVCVQIAGLVARRILCYVKKGQFVERGERYGFIRFGSRVDLYVPINSSIEVQVGRWVVSGSDVICFLPKV